MLLFSMKTFHCNLMFIFVQIELNWILIYEGEEKGFMGSGVEGLNKYVSVYSRNKVTCTLNLLNKKKLFTVYLFFLFNI